MNDFKNKEIGLVLTDSQKQALKELIDWFDNDKEEIAFLLYGAAGTGKTFLLNTFLNNYVRYGIAVTAPVHQAVRVLEKATGRKGKTFQSLHGLRPNVNLQDFNIDNVKFDTIGQDLMSNYKLVVVDESSQISGELHKLNLQRAKIYNTKILYVGDLLQLPPVVKGNSYNLSPIINLKRKFELTDIVRQKQDNPLTEPLRLLRIDILRETSSFLNYIHNKTYDINDKGEGYICTDLINFQNSLFKRFKETNLNDNPNYIRYAAWRNNNISAWNKQVRNMLHNSPEDIVIKDDILLGYNTIVDPNSYMESLITNSTIYHINDIIKRKSDYGFDIYLISLSDGYVEKQVALVDHKSSTFSKFVNKLSSLHQAAVSAQPYLKGRKWNDYYAFKNRYLTLIDINIKGYNKISVSSKDIDYGYGQTIHKLQGSTIENIYINLIDICYVNGDKSRPIDNKFGPKAVEFRNRLLYTALSRASKKAILLV